MHREEKLIAKWPTFAAITIPPTQWNRELFWPNRESWRENRDFHRPELESSTDEIFRQKEPLSNVRFSDCYAPCQSSLQSKADTAPVSTAAIDRVAPWCRDQ